MNILLIWFYMVSMYLSMYISLLRSEGGCTLTNYIAGYPLDRKLKTDISSCCSREHFYFETFQVSLKFEYPFFALFLTYLRDVKGNATNNFSIALISN